MTLVERINHEIKEAIRSQNQLRLNVLRMLKSKILAVDARASLPDAEVLKLFKTYLNNLQEAIEQSAHRPEIVDNLKREIVVVQEFLPKALTVEETRKIVLQAIAESGAKTKRELGLVMKAIMKINSAVDGKLAKELADQLLS
ncbi:MAG TPA: GatB/YqeY domain-containing protein [Chlamydiales bacterium]|nr:GatB/YqeY domain-containing protein [Chlamydiales bacterium]